jgi:hypothetical protein
MKAKTAGGEIIGIGYLHFDNTKAIGFQVKGSK